MLPAPLVEASAEAPIADDVTKDVVKTVVADAGVWSSVVGVEGGAVAGGVARADVSDGEDGLLLEAVVEVVAVGGKEAPCIVNIGLAFPESPKTKERTVGICSVSES